ncbi:MAG TPA: Npt1/Npt2 family nucleotide transporter, partial [Vicinamibacterales bacterium]|nr:Npt1/Npt2 family nucleotide transporter [Vicinamibacterales bacterium]
MPASPQSLLHRIVVLRPGEATTAWLMFIYSFLVMTAYNIIKPITRSKAISSLGADNLPYVLVGAAIVIGSLMHLYDRSTARVPRRLVAPVTQAGLALLLVVFWALFRTDQPWVSAAFFVFGLVFGLLLVSQFWTLANSLYDSRQARRLFGFIGGGASLGGITGAAVTTYAVAHVGSDNLALVSAGVLLLCAATVLAINKAEGGTIDFSATAEEETGGSDAWRLLIGSRHLQLIALIVGVAALSAVFVEQQLNMAVAESGATTDDITRFLGKVTMYLSMAGFIVQVGLTSRLHRSFGLAAALLLLPAVVGATSVIVLATSAVWAVALARVFDTSLRYTVDRTTREVLFLPLPVDVTQRAKPFVDVTVDRIARGVGAVLLIVLIQPWGVGLAWQQLAWVNLALVAAWIGLALAAHREYLDMFRRNLHTRAIEPEAVRFDVADSRTIGLLVSELWSPNEASVVYAIEMLETVGRRDVLPASLFAHESSKVRARALKALERNESADTESVLPAVRRLMSDPDAEVRAAAVRALAALQRDAEKSLLRPHLHDPSPGVAAAAAVELADSGVPDDEAAAEAALARLIADEDPGARRHAAKALARIRHPGFRTLLVPLIHDRDVSVAREAITSAGAKGAVDPLLVPALVSRLGHRELKQPARETLWASGESVVPVLTHVMADPQEHVWVRRHIPGTLQGIPCQASADALAGALEETDSFIRFKSLAAIERMSRTHPQFRPPAGAIEARLLRETAHYCDRLTLRQNLIEREAGSADTLLVRALDDKLSRSIDRIFRLLGLRYSAKDVAAARYTLEHGDARERASALEYLDHELTGLIRKRVMPIIDEAPLAERIRHANSLLKTRARDVPDTVAQLFHDNDAIVAAAAVHFAGEHGLRTILADDLEYLSTHAATPVIVQQVASWTRRRSGLAGENVPLVELVNRLRTIPVFAFVPVVELFRIAERATPGVFDPGRIVYEKGAPADTVLFLLTGTVRIDGADAEPETAAAPTAINLADALVGRPMTATVTTVDEAIGLSLDASALLTLLSDDSATAQALFRMLLGSRAALDRAYVTQWADDEREVRVEPGGEAIAMGLHLRRIPLFRKATANQVTALVAATREVNLTAGSILWDDSREPALYYLLSGDVHIES